MGLTPPPTDRATAVFAREKGSAQQRDHLAFGRTSMWNWVETLVRA